MTATKRKTGEPSLIETDLVRTFPLETPTTHGLSLTPHEAVRGRVERTERGKVISVTHDGLVAGYAPAAEADDLVAA